MAFEIVYEVAGKRVVMPLDKDEITIGRAPDCDIVIAHHAISRHHARLTRHGGTWRVVDLGSKNGTRVNELAGTDKDLRHGDRIFLHEVALVFQDAALPAPPAARAPLGGPGWTGGETMFRSATDFSHLASQAGEPAPKVDPLERLKKLVAISSRASETVLASTSLDETFRRMLELVFEYLPVERGMIALRDAAGELVPRSVQDASSRGGASSPFGLSQSIASKVIGDRMSVITTDAQVDERFALGHSIAGLGIRSAMAAPLWHGDAVDGLIYVDTTSRTGAFDGFDLDVLSALGNSLAVAVERSRLQELALEKERLERELEVAREIQMAIVPSRMPDLPGYDIAGLVRPAEQTGGDAFDLVPLEQERLMLLVGDATGHGVGPALSATQVRSMLRVALRLGAGLDEAFEHINDQLAQDLADHRFVTVFLGQLDARAHAVRYHSGGQGPLLLFHAASGQFEWRGATTMPLGLFAGLPPKPPQSLELAPGDILGLMTDGVFEYQDPAGTEFGIAGVEEIVRRHHAAPMAELCQALLDRLREFGQGRPQGDDITIVVVRRLP